MRMVDDEGHPSGQHSVKYADFRDVSNCVSRSAEFVQKTDFQDSSEIMKSMRDHRRDARKIVSRFHKNLFVVFIHFFFIFFLAANVAHQEEKRIDKNHAVVLAEKYSLPGALRSQIFEVQKTFVRQPVRRQAILVWQRFCFFVQMKRLSLDVKRRKFSLKELF